MRPKLLRIRFLPVKEIAMHAPRYRPLRGLSQIAVVSPHNRSASYVSPQPGFRCVDAKTRRARSLAPRFAVLGCQAAAEGDRTPAPYVKTRNRPTLFRLS